MIGFFASSHIKSFDNIAGPDDMPAHIKSSMFGCALTYAF